MELKRIRKTPVSSIMKKDIVILDRTDNVSRAVQLMKQNRVTSVIVKPRDDDDVYGILTERDVLEKVIDPGVDAYRDPWNTPVSEVMSKPLISVYPDMSLKYAIRLMRRVGIRHIAVMDGRTLVGVLSEAGILNFVEEQLPPDEHVAL